jgi:tRNA G18 (ribose-2'-O)-methylase SpoU
VPWETRRDIRALLRELRKEKIRIIAIEQNARSVDYKKVRVKMPVALVFGNEVGGIPQTILKLCDGVAEIPMRGTKESLNVSVAAGIVLYRLLDKY